jgi:serine/threonine-protein kinase
VKEPAPDVVIAGKYCLESQLAAGGMGSVWIARHLDLDRFVAVKFMDPACASAEGRIRFEREAKAAAYLEHPNVVAVQDYGVDDELPYIVMELLQGEDLEDRLMREGRLPLDEVYKIIAQAAKALRRAQELGIVHRDLKPHNLFLARGASGDDERAEVLKILDFGIAKDTGQMLAGDATQTGELMGSPNYMSPEHVRGAKDIDFRSDLWSLGVILFRAVTGKLPFESEVVGDVIGKILADPIPRATSIAPHLPPALDDFFYKALSRDRNLRFQSAREMAEAFGEIVRSPSSPRISFGPTSLRPPGPTTGLASSTDGDGTVRAAAVRARGEGARKSGPWMGVAAAAAALVVAIITLVAVTRGTKEGGAAAAAAGQGAAGAQQAAQAGAQQAGAPSAAPSSQPASGSTSAAATTGAPSPTIAAAPHPSDTAVPVVRGTAPRTFGTAPSGGATGGKPAATSKPTKSWGF